jgi:hypothetical protein
MKAAEKKLIERNLDLLFEFEVCFGTSGDYRKGPSKCCCVYEGGRRRKVQSLE